MWGQSLRLVYVHQTTTKSAADGWGRVGGVVACVGCWRRAFELGIRVVAVAPRSEGLLVGGRGTVGL